MKDELKRIVLVGLLGIAALLFMADVYPCPQYTGTVDFSKQHIEEDWWTSTVGGLYAARTTNIAGTVTASVTAANAVAGHLHGYRTLTTSGTSGDGGIWQVDGGSGTAYLGNFMSSAVGLDYSIELKPGSASAQKWFVGVMGVGAASLQPSGEAGVRWFEGTDTNLQFVCRNSGTESLTATTITPTTAAAGVRLRLQKAAGQTTALVMSLYDASGSLIYGPSSLSTNCLNTSSAYTLAVGVTTNATAAATFQIGRYEVWLTGLAQ